MCKFHQDIALDVARQADGTVDPTAYALNIIALGANCSIKHYMPNMKGVKGSMTYRIASQDSQQAFKQSGLAYDPDAFEAYRGNTLGFLQQETQDAIQQHGFDQNRPKVIKNRIKSFLQVAPDELYAPFNNLSADIFKDKKQAAAYQELRLAAADYWNKDGVSDILTERFKQSVTTIFAEAPEQTNPTLLKIYEAMPDKMKQFSECAGGVCASAGGTLAGHLGCIAKLAILPALGATSGISNDPAVMYGMMAGGTGLGIGTWQYLHYRRGTLPTMLENAVTYGTAVLSLSALMAWHTFGSGHDHHHGGHEPSDITYFDDDAGRRFMVRESVLCGMRMAKDTVINGAVCDTLVPYTKFQIDTIQLAGPPKAELKPLTP